MIKIGMFVDSFFPMVDGVTNVVDNYAKRLNDEEFEVVVFCPKNRDKKYVDNFTYRVERCKSVKIFFLDYDMPLPRFDRRYKKILKESNLDIVHIHSPFGVAKSGLRYAKKHKIPAIAFLHSQFKQDFYEGSKSKLITAIMLKSVMNTFNRCDEFYAVNQTIANVFLDYGAKHLPLVQRNSTDFMPITDREKAISLVNETYNLKTDETVFLFVGRICKLKNIFFLCDSLAKLEDKNFKMIFVGTGQSEDALKKYVEKLGLVNNVIFAGRIVNRDLLAALYCRAKLFLFPSMYDTNSLVQIEAASQSTPTLFLKGAATASTVTEDVNGFFADNSPEAYAKKIEEILNSDELYETVSKGAFRDLYINWDDTVDIMKGIYKEMIKNK
jgi:glycosyltransferase involved in cell wall biosynthesis